MSSSSSPHVFSLSEQDLINFQRAAAAGAVRSEEDEERDQELVENDTERNRERIHGRTGGATIELMEENDGTTRNSKPSYSSSSISSLSSSSSSSSPVEHNEEEEYDTNVQLSSAQKQALFQEMLRVVALSDGREGRGVQFSGYGEEEEEEEEREQERKRNNQSTLARRGRGEIGSIPYDDEADVDKTEDDLDVGDESFFSWLQNRLMGSESSSSSSSSPSGYIQIASRLYFSTSSLAYSFGRVSFFLLSSGLVLALPLLLAHECEKQFIESSNRSLLLERQVPPSISAHGIPGLQIPLPNSANQPQLPPGQLPPGFAPPPHQLGGNASGIPAQ